MTDWDHFEEELVSALKRDSQRAPDESALRAVGVRLGVCLPPDLSGLSALSKQAAGSGKATPVIAGKSTSTALGAWLLHPAAIFVASAGITAVLTSISPEPSAPSVTRPAPPQSAERARALSSQDPPLARRAALPEATASALPAAEATRVGRVRAPSSKSLAVPSAPEDPSLRAQQARLDEARRALAASDPLRALEALTLHRSEFPKTLFDEEREALTVKALHAAGRGEAARARAEGFRARYPRSVFLDGMREVLSIP